VIVILSVSFSCADTGRLKKSVVLKKRIDRLFILFLCLDLNTDKYILADYKLFNGKA
jgi:hypothetical protein